MTAKIIKPRGVTPTVDPIRRRSAKVIKAFSCIEYELNNRDVPFKLKQKQVSRQLETVRSRVVFEIVKSEIMLDILHCELSKF